MIPLLISCENATCAVPEQWRDLFRGDEEIVTSPEGWEPGSLNLAQGFAMRFRTPLVHSDVTRLLIDLDADGPARWSRYGMRLTDIQRAKLEDRHARPYLELLQARITEALRRDPLIAHIMVHTSTGDQEAVVIETIAGDEPASKFASDWARDLRRHPDPLRVEARITGTLPAIPTVLRQSWPSGSYAPLVLRVSQTFFLEGRPWRWEKLKKHLLDSLATAAQAFTPSQESPSSPAH